jgi:hypothetical protein
MALGIVSIITTSAEYAATRPTSIQVTFEGDYLLAKLEIYDANNILLSVLSNIENDEEYCIMDGSLSHNNNEEWLVPAPVYRLDFTTDLGSPPVIKITNIRFAMNVKDADGNFVFKEVQDRRITGNPLDGYVTGGNSKWVWDATNHVWVYDGPDIDGSGQWVVISGDGLDAEGASGTSGSESDGGTLGGTAVHVEAVNDIGDYYPAMGHNKADTKIDYGIVNMPVAKQWRGEL